MVRRATTRPPDYDAPGAVASSVAELGVGAAPAGELAGVGPLGDVAAEGRLDQPRAVGSLVGEHLSDDS